MPHNSSSVLSTPLMLLLHSGMVGSSGLEPPTSRLSGVRSNRLSYEPLFKKLVEISGIEPLTPCVQGKCSPS